MELVEGPDVAHELRRCGGLCVSDALQILTQLTRVVEHAHQLSVPQFALR
jgi:hypothetical protein